VRHERLAEAVQIIFLIWMWISNLAILLGAEFNAELERWRAVAGGSPASQEPFAELRDTRKLRKKKARRPAGHPD
jgi:membrane protein